jgi:ZIP family zinc transporter
MKILSMVLLSMGGSTVLGVLCGLCVRRISHKWHDAVLGFAAGVMLAAAVLGLLEPAFGDAGNLMLPVAGTVAGAGLISLLDRLVPHLHRIAGLDTEEHRANGSISKTLLFVAAIALHKIPEGLATGVSFGAEETGDIVMVAAAMSLQNIPEAFVIVAPVFMLGVRARRVVLLSCAIAGISMVSVVAGFALVSVFSSAVAFLLAMAGGAMLYVISDEMIPESHAHGFEKPATFSLIAGFLLVMVLQSWLMP